MLKCTKSQKAKIHKMPSAPIANMPVSEMIKYNVHNYTNSLTDLCHLMDYIKTAHLGQSQFELYQDIGNNIINLGCTCFNDYIPDISLSQSMEEHNIFSV